MFGVYFGNYLKNKGELSEEQYVQVINKCQKSRVKLGLLATESGFMTNSQAEEVNMIQQREDRRFGDIAVEKGYLSDVQVSLLLKQQGDSYLLFVQTMGEDGIMTPDEIQRALRRFAIDCNLDDEDIEALKSGDVDKEVSVFLNKSDLSEFLKAYVALTARFIVRFVDPHVRMGFTETLEECDYSHLAAQSFEGDKAFRTQFAGDDEALVLVAESILKEELDGVDMDTLDAVCEFLNMNNGLFARDRYETGVSIDMLPPVMDEASGKVTGEIYKIPFYVHEKELDLIVRV